MNHIGSGEEWGLELEEGGLEFLTPYAMSTTDIYRGKLDNLNFAMDFLEYGTDDEYVAYDCEKRTGVIISRMGASQAISVGAYAYALSELDKVNAASK
jgi:ADP-glucose pyrophosphorylase